LLVWLERFTQLKNYAPRYTRGNDERSRLMKTTIYRAHNLRGEQYGTGPVDWYADDVHVGTTRNGEGYEVVTASQNKSKKTLARG